MIDIKLVCAFEVISDKTAVLYVFTHGILIYANIKYFYNTCTGEVLLHKTVFIFRYGLTYFEMLRY